MIPAISAMKRGPRKFVIFIRGQEYSRQSPRSSYATGFVEALSPHNSVQAQSKYRTTFIPTRDRSSTHGPQRSNRLKELAARDCRILKQGQSTYHTTGLSTEKRPRRSARLKELAIKKRRGGKFAGN